MNINEILKGSVNFTLSTKLKEDIYEKSSNNINDNHGV